MSPPPDPVQAAPAGSWRERLRRALGVRTLGALAVLALGVSEACAELTVEHGVPNEGDFTALAGPLSAIKQPDDLLILAPAWQEPNARHALGDQLMPLAHVARPDESAFPRVVEIGTQGQRSPLVKGWPELSRETVGPFRLRVLKNPDYKPVVFDFVEGLSPEHAEVGLTTPHGLLPCKFNPAARVTSGGLGGPPTFPAQRFQCQSAEWVFMGVTVIDDSNEYSARRCIWAHPGPLGQIGVRYRKVQLGQVVRGYGQLPWVHERLWHGAPIELVVRVASEEVGRFVHQDGDGWRRFEFPLGAHAGTVADVEFEVVTKNPENRHFCFQADTR